jgi:hypothetical protein
MRALIGLMVVAPIVSSCLAIHVHDRPLAELEAERIATPYTKLPAGSIEPRGWLRKQLELQAAGFHGRLTEISPFLRRDGNAWLAKDGQGERGWEEVPYWLKGYIGCAFALNDPKMIAEGESLDRRRDREPGRVGNVRPARQRRRVDGAEHERSARPVVEHGDAELPADVARGDRRRARARTHA